MVLATVYRNIMLTLLSNNKLLSTIIKKKTVRAASTNTKNILSIELSKYLMHLSWWRTNRRCHIWFSCFSSNNCLFLSHQNCSELLKRILYTTVFPTVSRAKINQNFFKTISGATWSVLLYKGLSALSRGINLLYETCPIENIQLYYSRFPGPNPKQYSSKQTCHTYTKS